MSEFVSREELRNSLEVMLKSQESNLKLMSQNQETILKLVGKGHEDSLRHIRESLHEIRNSMAKIDLAGQEIATLKSEVSGQRDISAKNEERVISQIEKTEEIKHNQKWAARIFTAMQGAAILAASYFFKVDK